MFHDRPVPEPTSNLNGFFLKSIYAFKKPGQWPLWLSRAILREILREFRSTGGISLAERLRRHFIGGRSRLCLCRQISPCQSVGKAFSLAFLRMRTVGAAIREPAGNKHSLISDGVRKFHSIGSRWRFYRPVRLRNCSLRPSCAGAGRHSN